MNDDAGIYLEYGKLLEREDAAFVLVRRAVGDGRSLALPMRDLVRAIEARTRFEQAQGWDDYKAVDVETDLELARTAEGDR